MPWFKVDDGLHANKRVLAIPRRYRANVLGLWVLSGAWCANELTDGFLPSYMLDELAGTTSQAGWLVKVGLWKEVEKDGEKGYQFKDWDKYQPLKAEVEAKREAEAERKRKWRESRKSPSVRPSGTGASVPAESHTESAPPDPTRPDPTTPKGVESNGTTNVVPSPAKRGTRLPEGWKPQTSTVDTIREEHPGFDYAAEHRVFTDYWTSVAGSKGTKLDWDAVWRNWMRRAAKEQANKSGYRNQSQIMADIRQQAATRTAAIQGNALALIEGNQE